MSGTLDRWYVSGPLAVRTAFDEPTDAHSALSVSWSGVGSAIRHGGPETLNLMDDRPAAANQGPNLSLWGLNAGGKATRLGAITSFFATTADGGASGYMAFYVKRSGGDVAEALRITDAGSLQWGRNSALNSDQGGSIELGGHSSVAGTGTPYIDFHYQGL